MSTTTDQDSSPVQHRMSPSATASVVARWEWRTFVAWPLPPAIAAGPLGTLVGQTTHQHPFSESREMYFVSARTPHSVKIRAHRIQVKRLIRVDRMGLQQWRPMLDTPFPIGGVHLRALYTALGIARRGIPYWCYDQDDLIESVCLLDATLHVVEVVKHRISIRLHECVGERVMLTVAERQWCSVALEHDDPIRLRSEIHRLGLADFCNTSYPAFLGRVSQSPTHTPSTFGDVRPFFNDSEVV